MTRLPAYLLVGRFAALTVACSAAPLAAQQPTQPSPPAACLKTAKDWISAQMVAMHAADAKLTNVPPAEIQQKDLEVSRAAVRTSEKMAADCATTFNLATIPAIQLVDLIPLYSYAGDTIKSELAFDRMMKADMPPRDRARAWQFGMAQEINRQPTVYGMPVEGAERYVAMIDELPDSLEDVKLSAHKTMLGRYEYLDVASGLRKHANAVITLARRQKKPADLIVAYKELARSYADQLHPDSALRLLAGAEKELGAPATEAFRDFRHRYALIGTRAASVSAKYWINTDSKAVTTPVLGKVTLIEFTAHWCGPCKNSYPGLVTLAERFKGNAFQGVMVTQLYGYLGTQGKLTPEQEVAADQIFYAKDHGLVFPIAINPPLPHVDGDPFVQPQPDTDYRVSGIPEIVIIDKKGIIRQIVTGWDMGNTERFGRLIEQLLQER